MGKDILDLLAANERPVCNILVYFNLLQTKQDWLNIKQIKIGTIYTSPVDQMNAPNEQKRKVKLQKTKC